MSSALLLIKLTSLAVALHPGVRLLPAPAHRRLCASPRLAWSPAPDEAEGEGLPGVDEPWGTEGVPVGAEAEEGAGVAPTSQSWADEGGWDAWSDDADPASNWLSPAAQTSAPPPPPKRPIEAVRVGVVSGPFKRRNGYHVEVRVQHEGRAVRESSHRLWISHEVMIEIAEVKGREQWDLEVGEVAEAVIAYMQSQGVDLADADWGMQDDDVPFSHEQCRLRTLFDYYDGLKEHLAETLLPGAYVPREERPWGMNDWGQPTPRQELSLIHI